MGKPEFEIHTFKIPKGTVVITKRYRDGRIEEIRAPFDMTGITGDCSICHQFPCEHTAKLLKWR